jgi:predicted sulfurtransferase
MLPYTIISTYRFVPLSDLKNLRAHLLAQCKQWKLKGTILLSTEGINLFVAGTEEAIAKLLETLRNIPGLEDLQPKLSQSEHQPFTRMRGGAINLRSSCFLRNSRA